VVDGDRPKCLSESEICASGGGVSGEAGGGDAAVASAGGTEPHTDSGTYVGARVEVEEHFGVNSLGLEVVVRLSEERLRDCGEEVQARGNLHTQSGLSAAIPPGQTVFLGMLTIAASMKAKLSLSRSASPSSSAASWEAAMRRVRRAAALAMVKSA